MAEIQLTRIEIKSFMGIDKSSPVLIDFGNANKKKKTVTKLKGDQGTRKTSTMYGLMYLLGMSDFGFNLKELINGLDNTINANGEFKVDGDTYRVRATKDKWTLERDVNGKWYTEDEPKTTMRKLVGPLGISPMFLKEKKGADQIDWFRNTFSGGDEKVIKREQTLRANLQKAAEARREANREYTRLKKALEVNDLYQNAEVNHERFKEPVTIDSVKERYEKAQKSVNTFSKACEELKTISANIEEVDQEITELETRLARARHRKEELQERKINGEKYIAENATVQLDFQEAEKEFLNISRTLAEQEQWQAVLNMEKEMQEYETAVQRADTQKDNLESELQKLTKKYLPAIPELEIRMSVSLDDGIKEGIFYKGRSLAQLSESELWALFFLIWEEKGVNFIFVENITSLGSNAVETLNMLAGKGAKIFTTQVDRQTPVMKIAITDTIN